MSKLNTLPKIFQEALATHDVFRCLGYEPDQLFIVSAMDGHTKKPALFIKLETKEGDFVVHLGPNTMTDEELTEQWDTACAIYAASTEEEAKIMCEAGTVCVRTDLPKVAMCLRDKGIRIPSYEAFLRKTLS